MCILEPCSIDFVILCCYISGHMKIFYTSTTRGQTAYGTYYKEIYEEIANLGYQHLDDDIINTSYDEFVNEMESGGREAYVSYFKRKEECIQKADICIFEVSVPTLGLGFVTERAVKYGKPTIVLYYKDNIPYFVSGVENEKLIVRSYDENTIHEVLQESLQLARERRDKRFNFFLSPKLLDYLEEASTNQGSTKSKLIRDMIVDHMRRSSDTSVQNSL